MRKHTVISPTSLLLKNVLKGRMAEELAKADYKNHGFTIMDTGIGSDFKVIKK